MRTYKIYLIRHGTTQGNLESRYVGSTDLPLCQEGIDEINDLVDRCDYPNVGRVYSSPLSRCTQTAKLIYPSFEPVIVKDLCEYHFGEFENKSIAELVGSEKYTKWIESSMTEGLAEAEDMQSFFTRCMNGLNDVILDMMKNRISDAAVFTHGGIIMQLLASCGLPKRKPITWAVENGRGYTILVNASLWGNNKTVEVFTALPYGDKKTNDELGYEADEE